MTFGQYKSHFEQCIPSRIPDGLKGRKFLSIALSDVSLYDQSNSLFGDRVESKFPDISYDISEAGRCLALNRGTACVFHLMRVMEIAVQKLGRKLRVTIRNVHGDYLAWGQLLGNINRAVNQMPNGQKKSDGLKLARFFFESKIHGAILPCIQPRNTPPKKPEMFSMLAAL